MSEERPIRRTHTDVILDGAQPSITNPREIGLDASQGFVRSRKGKLTKGGKSNETESSGKSRYRPRQIKWICNRGHDGSITYLMSVAQKALLGI
jgi:hypothetical protein